VFNLNKELQNRFLILSAVSALGGVSSKKDTLDYLEENNLIALSDSDIEILKSRNEPKWRNELAFVRQHLVKDGYLSNEVRSMWSITDEGEDYLSSLYKLITPSETYQRLNSDNTLSRKSLNNDAILAQADSVNFIADLGIENESIEVKVKLIKRCQKIVKLIKNKYDSKCQIQSCGFTFAKTNGENYSEAHHLKPLSENGSQDESNVVILCPNHHRMFHFCTVKVFDVVGNKRDIEINGIKESIVYK